jgi:5-deoxy-D-glucuronate isomerase
MNRPSNALRLTATALLATAFAAAGAATLSSATYDRAHSELKTIYKAERDACDQQTANAKDICVETVKGKEKVAMAHLQYQRSGAAKDMSKLNEARYEARYEVAKEVCDDQAGNAKSVCVAQAKAARDKAKANVKMAKNVAEARQDADETKMKADFDVAQKRCDAMNGVTKDACMASARARFGQ